MQKGFHHLHYEWDFGDRGLRRQRSTGPIAAAVFETPGVRTVTLTVTDPEGNASSTSVRINVQSPGERFAGTKTVCFSNTKEFAGAPPGARLETTSSFDFAMRFLRPGRRLLFRRGDEFVSDEQHGTDVGTGAVIGAFGEAISPDERGSHANDPVIVCKSDLFSGKGRDLTVMDLQFEPAGASRVMDARGLKNCLFLRLAVDGFDWPFAVSHDVVEYYKAEPHDQVFFVGCKVKNSKEYAVYCGGERLVFMDNLLSRVSDGHVLRITFARGCLIAGNQISYSARPSLLLKLHAAQDKDRYGAYTERVVVSENDFRTSGSWAVVVGPQNATSDERVRDVILQRNTMIGEPGTRIGFRVNSADTTLRNNLLLAEGATSMLGIGVSRWGEEPIPTGIEVYHNTAYSSTRGEEMTVVYLEHHEGPAIVKNNLVYAPAMRVARVVGGDLSAREGGNLADVNPRFIDPASGDFELRAGSRAIDRGVPVPVLGDLHGRRRPSGIAPDVGAIEVIR